MKNAPMRFGGLSLSHNPSKLIISDEANIMELGYSGAQPDSRLTGRGLCTVSGEGELYGSDCMEQYEALRQLYLQGKSSVLSIPHRPPMRAYLSKLRMTAEPVDDVLGYSFVFVETKGSPVKAQSEYTVTEENESLWDIAYEFGADIDTLVALNPQIPLIGHLSRGEKVRLC